jgi:MYXO-CTERM domain-containing protein
VGFFAAGTAWAAKAPETLGTPDPEALPVYGGMDTVACGWPTTVSVQGSCTGTLVHPQVVIYAAHCGTGYNSMQFGEVGNQPARSVPTEFCRSFPGGGPGNGQDFAFCKLAEPQTDIPIVPILVGCEVDQYLKPGQQVTIVGFGLADAQPDYGIKREVVTTINGFQGQEISIGGGGKDSCNGDSGGPVFVQIADGSWRVFGITSYGGQCGSGGVYSMMHNGIQWFESESGLDLTPCHDVVNNTWQPTPLCKGFPMMPGAGNGTWANGCAGGPLSGFSTSCGAPPEPDETPPIVSIVTPPDLMQYMMPGGVDLEILVDAQDPDSGIKSVQLTINGAPVGAPIAAQPYSSAAKFPDGMWCVGATATNFSDLSAEAVPHCIYVNVEPEPPEPESTSGGDTDSDGGSGSGSGVDTESPPTSGATDPTADPSNPTGNPTGNPTATAGLTDGSGDADEGCGCRSHPDGGLLALAGLGLLGLRRRRRG